MIDDPTERGQTALGTGQARHAGGTGWAEQAPQGVL